MENCCNGYIEQGSRCIYLPSCFYMLMDPAVDILKDMRYVMVIRRGEIVRGQYAFEICAGYVAMPKEEEGYVVE